MYFSAHVNEDLLPTAARVNLLKAATPISNTLLYYIRVLLKVAHCCCASCTSAALNNEVKVVQCMRLVITVTWVLLSAAV